MAEVDADERLATGISGLDEILDGGFIGGRSYMLRGEPGAGKTILGFHFLTSGVDAGETALFVNLEEDVDDLRANAASLGFDVDAVDYLDLSPTAEVFAEDQSYGVFEAAEVEQEPFTERIVDRVEEIDPDRVVVDPVTQLRHLTSGEYQFRKQVIGFMRYLKSKGATVLFTAQESDRHPTDDLQFISDGTILLQMDEEVRRVRVPKFRGSATRSGEHTFRITDEGIVVYPELRPGQSTTSFESESISSDVPEVDALLNGGLERGTVSILTGPTGVGKTTLGTQFMNAAASRGERSVIYLFEETEMTFVERSEAIGIPVRRMMDEGSLRVEEVEALDKSPQEFAQQVKREVEVEGASIVMVDGISGYELTLQGERSATNKHLHALGNYLKHEGVTGIIVDETPGITGEFAATSDNISYLADNIVFLRHLELRGEMEKTIGVLKKRTSDFERTLRRFQITSHGIEVGEPLTNLQGVLTGTPEFVDDRPE
ncbi:MAG: ATPase domain-containing protein [Haloplanus sp.]